MSFRDELGDTAADTGPLTSCAASRPRERDTPTTTTTVGDTGGCYHSVLDWFQPSSRGRKTR